MVYLDTVLESLATIVDESSRVSDSVTPMARELDLRGLDRDKRPPHVTFVPEVLDRDNSRNTDLTRITTDSNGVETDRYYETWWTADISANVLTRQRGPTDHRSVVQSLHETFSAYETRKLGYPFPNPSGSGTLDEVTEFTVADRQRNHDFTLSHAVRGSQLTLRVLFEHELAESSFVGTVPTVNDVTVNLTVAET